MWIHVIDAKFWPYRLSTSAKIEIYQTSSYIQLSSLNCSHSFLFLLTETVFCQQKQKKQLFFCCCLTASWFLMCILICHRMVLSYCNLTVSWPVWQFSTRCFHLWNLCSLDFISLLSHSVNTQCVKILDEQQLCKYLNQPVWQQLCHSQNQWVHILPIQKWGNTI